jgi:hypothetical protein
MNTASSTHGEERNAYRISVGEPERNRPIERLRRRLDDINTNPRGIGYGNENLIALTQDREQ